MSTDRLMLCVGLVFALGAASAAWAKEGMEDTIEWYDAQVLAAVEATDEYHSTVAGCGYTGIRCPDGSPGWYSFAEATGGIAAIYEATDREYYLQRLIDYSKRMMAAGKDNNSDGYLDYYHWMKDRPEYCQWDYDPPYNYGSHCYWNAMRTIGRTARVGRLGPHYQQYKADIDQIVQFCEKQVIEKWEKGNQAMPLEQWLSQPSFTISGGVSHAGSFMVDVYLATGNDHYGDLATRFAEKVKNAWVPFSNGSYAWAGDGGVRIPVDLQEPTFDLNGKTYGVQDTAHSIRVIRFAAIAHRAGIVVTDEDMQRLVKTFTRNIWRGDDEVFHPYINGSGDIGKVAYSVITDWVRVGAFDQAAHEMLVNWTGGPRRPDKYNQDKIHYFGILALNLKLQAVGYALEAFEGADE